MTKEYIKYIQQFLSIEILHWNYVAGQRNVIIEMARLKRIGVSSVYIPFIYKNKQINLEKW
jgi:hypothetical protein